MELEITNRYEWRTPEAIHAACMWPDGSATVRTGIGAQIDDTMITEAALCRLGERVRTVDALPLSGVVGSARTIAELLRKRALLIVETHTSRKNNENVGDIDQERLAEQASLCVKIAGEALAIAEKWKTATKTQGPAVADEILIDHSGTVHAVELENGTPRIRRAGAILWSYSESRFCPLRMECNGAIGLNKAVIVRKQQNTAHVAAEMEHEQSWHEHVWTWFAEARLAKRIRVYDDTLVYEDEQVHDEPGP